MAKRRTIELPTVHQRACELPDQFDLVLELAKLKKAVSPPAAPRLRRTLMSSKFFEIDCGDDEPVVMERCDDGELVFHGWDIETELAAQELGFQPSACFVVWDAKRNDRLDKALLDQAAEGHAAIVELMLAAGADVDAQSNAGWTALR